MLDHHQEVLARKYDGGHWIIKGPIGEREDPHPRPQGRPPEKLQPLHQEDSLCLLQCHPCELYQETSLRKEGADGGEEGVEVLHFFELCAKITGERLTYEKEESEFSDLVLQETLSRLKNNQIKYDAVLVDEGQDFSDDMLRVVTAVLNEKTDNLTIALDENQTLYQRVQTWKELGIKVQGRVHRISCCYRNTREISRFASRLIGKRDDFAEANGDRQNALFQDAYAYNGPRPENLSISERGGDLCFCR